MFETNIYIKIYVNDLTKERFNLLRIFRWLPQEISRYSYRYLKI